MNVLVADIGGTNTTLAILNQRNVILHKERVLTKSIINFSKLVNTFLKNSKHSVTKGCFAVAGPITKKAGRNFVKMSHAQLTISERALEKDTPLTHAHIINDFEAIGYGTTIANMNDITLIRHGKSNNEPRVIIGAGTGLGKVLMVFDKHTKKFLPVKSELGHTDIPIHNAQELHILDFIKDAEQLKGPVTYGMVLSGSGLERLYEYYSHKRLPALTIVQRKDAHAKYAVATFIKFYARCFRNEIINSMATGGIYIAGGIAAANPGLFGTTFLTELNKHHTKAFRKILRQVPVTLITNYDISLKGAAVAR